METNKLKILIVEDDFSFALELELLIQKIGYNPIEAVDNSGDALDIIYSEKPDLILMDIDIKGRLTGVEIGQKIKHLDIPIIYITSFDDETHYHAAEQTNMMNYLVKPVNYFNLKSTVNFAIKSINAQKEKEDLSIEETSDFVQKDSFYFKKKEIYHKVSIDEIDYVESDNKYCFIHTNIGQKFMVRITLPQVEKNLPPELFIRIHRSFIVMINKISTVNFSMGTLSIGKKELPISRVHRKVLQEMMHRF